MTPYKIMEIALASVGLAISNTGFKTRAREYLDLTAVDITNRTRWAWRFKDTTLTTVASTRGYSLASDVLEPLAFRDQTNNHPLEMATTYVPDTLDPDASETGQPRVVVLTGINATTGYWSVDLFPTPTATLTIGYRYFSYWTPLNSNGNDDTTDLAPKIPAWVQPALIKGVTEKFQREKGNYRVADRERQEMEAILAQALTRNTQSQGQARTRMPRDRGASAGPMDISVREGSLT